MKTRRLSWILKYFKGSVNRQPDTARQHNPTRAVRSQATRLCLKSLLAPRKKCAGIRVRLQPQCRPVLAESLCGLIVCPIYRSQKGRQINALLLGHNRAQWKVGQIVGAIIDGAPSIWERHHQPPPGQEWTLEAQRCYQSSRNHSADGDSIPVIPSSADSKSCRPH